MVSVQKREHPITVTGCWSLSCRAGARPVSSLCRGRLLFLQCKRLGQVFSHFLSGLSACPEHTVGSLTTKALVVKPASDVPTLLCSSLLPLWCQNWHRERLCTSSSEIMLQKGVKTPWSCFATKAHCESHCLWCLSVGSEASLLGQTAPGGLWVQKIVDGSYGTIPAMFFPAW